jgi:hypothetical protein
MDNLLIKECAGNHKEPLSPPYYVCKKNLNNSSNFPNLDLLRSQQKKHKHSTHD